MMSTTCSNQATTGVSRASAGSPIRRLLSLVASLGAIFTPGLFPAGALALSVGEAAPRFELQGSDDGQYTLEGLLADHGGVVLAFFPKAFTPG